MNHIECITDAMRKYNDNTIVHIARAICNEKRFEDMPVLADALEESGCVNPNVLSHCRGPNCHNKHCWVISLILKVNWIYSWKTINIGTEGLATGEDFWRTIGALGMAITTGAEAMLFDNSFSAVAKPKKITLAKVSLNDTFPTQTIKNTHEHLSDVGLELCPKETGPQLRLQFQDQPIQTHLRIASETMTVPRCLFVVGRSDDLKYLGDCSNFHSLSSTFIFKVREELLPCPSYSDQWVYSPKQ